MRKDNMFHYVCSGGCLTIQSKPGFCPIKGCYRYRNLLSTCDCQDGKHGDWLYKNHPDPLAARKAARNKLTKLARAFKSKK